MSYRVCLIKLSSRHDSAFAFTECKGKGTINGGRKFVIIRLNFKCHYKNISILIGQQDRMHGLCR